MHGLYDFPLFVLRGIKTHGTAYEDLEWGMFIFFLAVLAFELTWAVRIVRRLRREQVRDAAMGPKVQKG